MTSNCRLCGEEVERVDDTEPWIHTSTGSRYNADSTHLAVEDVDLPVAVDIEQPNG
jgi:hypothetical protein